MFIINMSCGNPYTNRDEQLARQLQKEEDNISSNSNLAKKYQEVYDKEAGIYGFDPVFDTDGNRNLANKISSAESEDDIDLIFQKHANERRKFLAKSEKINEKIIDKPKPLPKPVPIKETSIFIDFSQTILDLSPFIFLFIIIVFIYYSSNNKKGTKK